MLEINIICIGKLKEDYLKKAVAEYAKRLSKYCHLMIVELQDEKLPNKLYDKELEEIKRIESKRMIDVIKKDTYVICLDLKGKQYTSEAFSQKIEEIALHFNHSITFIIGGTLGINEELLNLAKEKISFSTMTFPHQFIRIFLLEQLFRAFKISHHERYHW